MAKQDNEVERTSGGVAVENRSTQCAACSRPAHPGTTLGLQPGENGSPVGQKLIVGSEIELSGNISACERLVVEGRVEAHLHDCREIEIARTGTFKGSAARSKGRKLEVILKHP